MKKLLPEQPPSSNAHPLARRAGGTGLMLLAASMALALVVDNPAGELAQLWLGAGKWVFPLLLALLASRLWRGVLGWWRTRFVTALFLPFAFAAGFSFLGLQGGLGGEEMVKLASAAGRGADPFLAAGITGLVALVAVFLAFPEMARALWESMLYPYRRIKNRPSKGWTHGDLLAAAAPVSPARARLVQEKSSMLGNLASSLKQRRASNKKQKAKAAKRSKKVKLRLPPLALFDGRVEKTRPPSPSEIEAQRQALGEVLRDFGVEGEMLQARAGPVVTLFEFAPARGTRAAKITSLSDDIARSMCAESARVAVIQGHHALGIELPNPTRQIVPFAPLARLVRQSEARLPLALGVALDGSPVIADLSTMPHLLVAGTTGSGKSVGINAMILSLLSRLPAEDCRLIMIDPKMTEFALFAGIPHLLTPVITEAKKAVAALKWVVREMERRYRLLSSAGQRHIETYNHLGKEQLPFIVVLIDEMSDLMLVAGKEIEIAMQRLAQMARASGIHLITATQRPSVDVITGTIKANFPTRISFQTSSRIDSRTILDTEGAEKLLGRGDLLFMQGAGRIQRVHAPFVSEKEADNIANWLREQLAAAGGEAASGEEIIAEPEEEESAGTSGDTGSDLYARAVQIVLEHKRPTTSFLQRKLQIGYNRAAGLIERMESDSIISPPNHTGKREVLR